MRAFFLLLLAFAAVCCAARAEPDVGSHPLVVGNGNRTLLGSYDHNTAKTRLIYAYAPYCDKNAVSAWKCRYCYLANPLVEIAPIEHTGYDLFGFAGWSPKEGRVILSFRGTMRTSIPNWIQNLKTTRTAFSQWPGTSVHTGFLQDWLAVKNQVIKAISYYNREHANPEIVIVGHSLGGALATLATAALSDLFSNTLHLYTFGSPRVGDPAFTGRFAGISRLRTSWRVTNKHDVVPHMPIGTAFNFRHIAQEIWYKESYSYQTCDGTGEDNSCSRGVPTSKVNVADHLTYLATDLAC